MEQSISKRAKMWGLGAVFALGVLGTAMPAEAKPPAHAPAHGYRRKQAAVRTYKNPRYGTTYYRTRRTVDVDYDGIPDYRDRYLTHSQFITRRLPRRKDKDRDGIRNRRDRDKDGDGVPDKRDKHPNNPRRR